jgi:hypothetical protein
MSRSKGRGPIRLNPTARQHYLNISRRPLQILAFLLPLIVLYEIGLVMLLRSEHGVLTNKAHQSLLQFFNAFGVAPSSGFYLGGIVIVVVLAVWHVLNRDPWTVDYGAVGIMGVESLALTVPLLVLGQILTHASMPALNLELLAQSAPSGDSGVSLAGLSLVSKLAISVGAGLYEELMFRMLLIAVLHTLLVDVGKASHNVGAIIAVVVSAAAFTAYHPLRDAAGGLSVQKLAFFFLAGLYFGAIYVVRGFGIVVGVHALYDIVTVSLLSSPPS